MRFSKRAGVVGATAVLVAGLTVVAGGTANASSPCDYVATANNSDTTTKLMAGSNLFIEPSEDCTAIASYRQGSTFYAWCAVSNYYGNQWVYGRLAGEDTKGWVSISVLGWVSGPKSIAHC
ncbi:hypothetical protein K7472_02070 [Streptomyces sp. PTM05]|uniref:SH3 domain-containing protein n=1 Tax=Streptantibioticus parmotrematis TaxID=2873249 RepID=A0ABS7QKD8_9ACTN|nr:hypothetical protein [Streptantibioticus parmotrematis]MBY8883633.1 hypothetical protein [Streptantibioticus parmotrematis]